MCGFIVYEVFFSFFWVCRFVLGGWVEEWVEGWRVCGRIGGYSFVFRMERVELGGWVVYVRFFLRVLEDFSN